MHEERNELEEAEKHFRLAVALHAKAPPAAGVRSDWSTERATVHCNFGNLLSARKEWEEAEAQFRLAVAEGERVYADFPNHFINRRDLGVTYGNLSNLYAVRRRWPEAEVTLKKGLTIQEKLVVDFAYIPAMKVDLAATCCNYGMLLNDLGRPTEALPWLDRAVDTLRAVLAKEPRTTNARAFLGNSHWGRATANEYLQRPADALKEWDAALEYSPKKSHPFIRYRRSEALIRLGQTAEAVTEVGQLRKLNDWNATQWYDFACVYAVAADEIADEKQNYADRAMEVLQKAVRAGYKDTAHMKEDKDLDSLRERDDFKKLVAELEKKFPPKREELPAPRADK